MMEGDTRTDVLHAVHVSSAIFFDVRAASTWASEAPHTSAIRALVMPDALHLIEYHALLSGSCWAGFTDSSHQPL